MSDEPTPEGPTTEAPATAASDAAAASGPPPADVPDLLAETPAPDTPAPDPGAGVPETPDDYTFELPDVLGEADPDVNRRLHEAGFTQDQARLVYELAAERLVPLVETAAEEMRAEREIDRLAREFGGRERWQATARELRAWGEARLPPDVLTALGATAEGCLALHRMMQEGTEPALGPGGGASEGANLDALRSRMRDPRYWRERDPAVIAEVEAGFRRLYGG